MFKSQFFATNRGIKTVNKTERKDLVILLDRNAQKALGKSLEAVLEQIFEEQYANNADLLVKIRGNIPKYLDGTAGIGLALLLRLGNKLGVNVTYIVHAPGNEVLVEVEVL